MAQYFVVVVLFSLYFFTLESIATHQIVNNRRQEGSDVFSEKELCVLDKFDVHFEGQSSPFITECRDFITASERELKPNFSDPNFQAETNAIHSTFCAPECGNFLLSAFKECKFYSFGQEQYLADLCGTNRNGTKCYEILLKSATLSRTERFCNITEQCECKAVLERGVSEQGCCINALHDFVPRVVAYTPKELYDACGVELPETGCNNSPIGTTSGCHANFKSSGILFALFATITVLH